jgi:hypothetical protein
MNLFDDEADSRPMGAAAAPASSGKDDVAGSSPASAAVAPISTHRVPGLGGLPPLLSPAGAGAPSANEEIAYHDAVRDLLAEAIEAAEAKAAATARAEEEKTKAAPVARAPRFTLDSDRKVEWLVRLMGELHAARARLRAQAKAIEHDLTRDLAHLADRFGIDLGAWLDSKITRGRGRPRKSQRTLAGTVGRALQPHGPIVRDRAAAARWAEAHEPDNSAPRWGEIRYVFDPRKLVADLRQTGEAADGVEYREKKDATYVAYRDVGGHEHRVGFAVLARELKGLPAPDDDEAIEPDEDESDGGDHA